MIQKWFDNYYIVYILGGLCGIGLLIKLITNFIYIRLVRASAIMGTSRNKLVKQMKLKFETFYKLKIGVNNVDIFVDKYVYKYKVCGLLLSTWDNISGLMLIMCLLIAPVASILGLIMKCGEDNILYTFFAGVCSSAVLILVDNLFNIPSKRQLIKLNMKDYLENYLKARLEQEAMNPEIFQQYRAEMASSSEHGLSPRKIHKEEKRLEKEQKERQKLLELETKQKEREQAKKDKIEWKEAEIARKSEEKRQMEEDRRRKVEEKAKEKRRAIEEKEQREQAKLYEKQQAAEMVRLAAAEKAAKKMQESAKKVEEKEQLKQKQKEQNTERRQAESERILQKVYASSDSGETAAAMDNRKNEKLTKIQQRNERLKEEIQAQREQREKDRMDGKDPFESFTGNRKVDNPKNYKVNDFNMEYEMRKKAVQRETDNHKVQEQSSGQAVQEVATAEQNIIKEKIQIRGNSPSEDKVIDDILKEFLA